jgi:hypothetical protein
MKSRPMVEAITEITGRDFLYLATAGFAGVGSLSPSFR